MRILSVKLGSVNSSKSPSEGERAHSCWNSKYAPQKKSRCSWINRRFNCFHCRRTISSISKLCDYIDYTRYCVAFQWTKALCIKCCCIWKQVMEIYYWLQNWLYRLDAHDNRIRLIEQPYFHVLYAKFWPYHMNVAADQVTFFQSSIVQFWWACASCSLRFLFLADRSGTRCGLLRQGSTCCAFRDGFLHTLVVTSGYLCPSSVVCHVFPPLVS